MPKKIKMKTTTRNIRSVPEQLRNDGQRKAKYARAQSKEKYGTK
jgi:hypothetical protein